MLDAADAASEATAPLPAASEPAASELAAPLPAAPPRSSRAAASRRGCADHGQDQGQDQDQDQDPWIGARRAPRVPLSPAPNAANQISPVAVSGKLGDQGDAAAGRQTRGRRRTTNAGALHELQHL